MQTAHQFDVSTLNWVKGEIDETIKQARISLESYAEDPDEDAQLRACIVQLHQVSGTLEMVELGGAARFAKEVERLALAIELKEFDADETAYEILMRGLLQLPYYLESLQEGHPDNLMPLLPLINEMRQMRGAEPLDVAAFFTPDLSVPAPEAAVSAGAGQTIVNVARETRRFYQAALLKLLRGEDVDKNLGVFAAVFHKLLQVAEDEHVRRWLWVCRGFATGLQKKSIPLERETKSLLGKFDKLLKQLIETGETGLDTRSVNELVRTTLYQVALAEANTPQLVELKQAFKLDDYLPGGSAGVQQQGAMAGFNADLKQTIAADVLEELTRVKDSLDVFVRGDHREKEGLSPMVESLSSMADTLKMLQEDGLCEILVQQVDAINAMIDGTQEISDGNLMGIAGAVLSVESALKDWGGYAPAEKADDLSEQVSGDELSPQAEAEHHRVIRQVMKEAKDDLVYIREAISLYLDDQSNSKALEEIPARLHQISGGMELLSYKRVAQILGSCQAYISDKLIASDSIPAESELDQLADAIMSIEYYLEAFVQNKVHPGSALEFAERAVAELGYPMGSGVRAEPEHIVAESLPETVEEVAPEELEVEQLDKGEAAEGAAALPEIEPVEIEIAAEPPVETSAAELESAPGLELEEQAAPEVTAGSAVEEVVAEPEDGSVPELEIETTDIEVTAPEQEAAAVEIEETIEAAPVISEAQPESAPVNELDDEIIEIFVEEAEEEFARINELLPQWKSSPSDEESLRELRRSFHTLKGSGRLVGASDVGEFAWAFESLLNRVIDGTVPHNNVMFDVLEMAQEALPQLLEQFRSGKTPSADIQMLTEAAEDLSKPGGMQVAEATPAEMEAQPEAIVEEEAPAAEAAPSALDPVLLDIYSKEAETHLAAINDFLAQVKGGEGARVSEPLIRALHTLQGSSRMAGIEPVAEVSAVLEKYAKTLQAEQRAVDDEGLSVLEDTVGYINSMMAHLLDNNQPEPDRTELQLRADGLYAAVQHLEHGAQVSPEAGLAAVVEEIEEVGESAESATPVEATEAEAGADVESIDIPDIAALLEEEEIATPEEQPGLEEIEAIEIETAEPEIGVEEEPAQEEAAVPAEAEVTLMEEDYDPELLEIFLEEGTEILDASEETLQSWVDNPDDRSLAEALQRQLHTLKGGARMAGVTPIGNLSHSLESTFEGVVEGRLKRSKEMMELLQLALDRLVTMLEKVRDHEPLVSGDDLIRRVDALARSSEAGAVAEPEEAEVEVVAETMEAPALAAESKLHPMFGTAMETLEQIRRNIQGWKGAKDESELIERLQNNISALATDAANESVAEIADMALCLKDTIQHVLDGHIAVTDELVILYEQSTELLGRQLEQLGTNEPLDSSQVQIQLLEEFVEKNQAQHAVAEELEEKAEQEREAQRAREEEERVQNRRKGARVQHEVIRVRSDILNNMVNFAGEVSIYRSRVEQQIGSFRFSIEELDQTVARLRDQLRQFDIETEAQIDSRRQEAAQQGYEDFDPLEFDRFTNMQQLSRSMMESLSDLVSVEEALLGLTRESETLLLQQSRVNTELQESLMQTRMVPLVENAPRLRRIVRQTCSELGKEAKVTFSGADVKMDRNVVERMMAPLEHMLRNAIAHGIESPEERKKKGKSPEGTIKIALSREGSEVVINVSDDGRGIDLERVRAKALDRGLISEGAELGDHELMQFILESGLSTAESLSQVAGRGVGMDVVNSEIKQLSGVLTIDSQKEQGTVFTIRLPLTLSVSRALLVNAGEDIYAIPLLGIQGIERISHDELDELMSAEQPIYHWVGQDYDLLNIASVLGAAGPSAAAAEGSKLPVLLTQSGDQRVALLVDGLLGSREIVVKSLGPQLSTLQDLAGATILADGSVALIIDMPSLIRHGLAKREVQKEAPGEQVEAAAVSAEPLVMVVDDSITVRKVSERLLKRNEMRTISAKDGVDALAALEEQIPDVMLLDIEMPRMDGYELATHIRNSDRLKDIPIIMITSRTGEKHKQRAMEIGVNVYMGKPFTESDLLENIHALLKK